MKSIIPWASVTILALQAAAFVGWLSRGEDHGGTLICTSDRQLIVRIGNVQGLDTRAVADGLRYLCDPDTMAFGFNNPKWFLIKQEQTK